MATGSVVISQIQTLPLRNVDIDVDKDWGGMRIRELGAPILDTDALPLSFAIGMGADVYSSDYGLNWVDLGAVASGQVYGIAYLGNGIVILGDGANHVWRSTDYGLTWTDLGAITTAAIWDVTTLGNGIALLGDNARHIFRSTDYGLTWVDLGAITTGSCDVIRYLGNGIVIAGCSIWHVWRSEDYGATWADLGVIAAGQIWGMANLGNGVAIMGDSAEHIFRSDDYGATWVDLGVIATDDINVMCYLGNGIVLMGDSARHIYRSTSSFQLGNFNPHQLDKVLQFGCLGAITPNGTSYLAPGNGATQLNEIRIRAPRAGILRNLYVWQRVASGAGGRTDIYTVRVDGGNTAITCTLDNVDEGADIANEVLVGAGDSISISLVSNNALDASADVIAVLELM